jgi:hypothetical protein
MRALAGLGPYRRPAGDSDQYRDVVSPNFRVDESGERQIGSSQLRSLTFWHCSGYH